jgi:hypothetical protein
MNPKRDVQQGTLALMMLRTLDLLGPLHGYGIARRIEQISGDLLSVNQGTELIHFCSGLSRRVPLRQSGALQRTTAEHGFIV